LSTKYLDIGYFFAVILIIIGGILVELDLWLSPQKHLLIGYIGLTLIPIALIVFCIGLGVQSYKDYKQNGYL
jgi:hypothetical protein